MTPSFQHHLPKSGFVGLLLGAVLALAAACAPINPDHCPTADWFHIGVNDGKRGLEDRSSALASTCANVGVAPDLTAYAQGREAGLLEFCTFDSGYERGLEGRRDPSPVCPAHLISDISVGYNFGKQLHDTDARLAELEEALIAAEVILAAAESTSEERADARLRVRRILRERDDLQAFRDSLLTSLGAYRYQQQNNGIHLGGAAG